MSLVLIVLIVVGVPVCGVITHTAIVQLCALWHTRIECDAELELARAIVGKHTKYDVKSARSAIRRLHVDTPDGSRALARATNPRLGLGDFLRQSGPKGRSRD